MVKVQLASVAILIAFVGCGASEPERPRGGASIHILFDERHGLEGGELVRLHEFDIGVVESVDLARSKVRASVSLSPEALSNLTTATTFTVESKDGSRYLETHVLDPDAPALTEGASVDGADGSIELMAMRASAAAGGIASSEWWGKAGEFVDGLKKDLEAIEWSDEEQDLRQEWEQIVEQMDEAVEDGSETLRERVDELVKELEDVGRSDEAEALKKRFDELLDQLGDGR